jgi:hypothetical protein
MRDVMALSISIRKLEPAMPPSFEHGYAGSQTLAVRSARRPNDELATRLESAGRSQRGARRSFAASHGSGAAIIFFNNLCARDNLRQLQKV